MKIQMQISDTLSPPLKGGTLILLFCSMIFSILVGIISPHFPSIKLAFAFTSNLSLSTSTHDRCKRKALSVKDTTTTENKQEENLISEMDARVLQSMLRDSSKLDLEQIENMKKLLERVIIKDETDEKIRQFNNAGENNTKRSDGDEEDQPYSSQVVQTLASTKFWKALKRNASEVIESVAIAATNQIEKSAKIIVGLGFFAWERAKQDAARALPTISTKSSQQNKWIFQLEEKSSYEEPSSQAALRQEFTTLGDEISGMF